MQSIYMIYKKFSGNLIRRKIIYMYTKNQRSLEIIITGININTYCFTWKHAGLFKAKVIYCRVYNICKS